MTSELRALLIAAVLAAGCADFSRGAAPDAAPDAGASDGGGGAGFAPVHALLLSGCQRCHQAGGEAGTTALVLTGDARADRDVVARLVDTSSPEASRLLSKMSGHGHTGGAVFNEGSPEYAAVLRWIQEGARP